LKTAYLTDEFSTLGGLGAVAYKDPEFFREVQNQIYFGSPTQFADVQRPSDIFESFLGNKKIITQKALSVLESNYAADGEVTDYLDINTGPDWRQTFLKKFYPVLQNQLDSTSSYNVSLIQHISATLSIIFPKLPNQEITLRIVEQLEGINTSPTGAKFAAVLAGNNPQTKLSVPPPNSKVPLDSSVDLGLDYRGVNFATGYSTLEDYWGNIPYPGMSSPSIIPATLRESILGGLVGYSSSNPLEAIYNPVGAGSIVNVGFNSSEAINFSDPFGSGFILGEIPFTNIGDTDVSISLIGETLNGLTTFDPTPSPSPEFAKQNPDADGGLNPLSRSFNLAF
jgi:hypothetical protein